MQLIRSSLCRLRCGIVTAVLFFALLGGAATVEAQQSVYGPRVPQNAGFLRLVNGADTGEGMTLRAGGTLLGPVAPAMIGPYRTVTPGVYLLRVQGHTVEVIIRPGGYQSVVLVQSGLFVFSDTVHDDPARAQLVLYNVTSLPAIDLVTLPAAQDVLSGVSPGTSGTIAVNAVTVTLGVRSGASVITLSEATVLERGQSTGIFLVQERSGLTVLTGNARVELGDG